MSTWPQRAYVYDGTFSGFLTCVGESFRRREYPFYFLTPGAEQVSLYPLREIPTDPGLAKSIYRALETEVSETFQGMITYSFLTCLPQKERHIYDVVYLGLTHALPQDLSDDRILILSRAVRSMTREADYYRDCLRFSDYGGVLVGQITPKNRVLPLLRPYFCQHLSEEAFLLHDRTHREGLFYAHHRWKLRPVEHLDLERADQAEPTCLALWRQFYETVAGRERTDAKPRTHQLTKRVRNVRTALPDDPA